MAEFYLVRHGQTTGNLNQKVYQTTADHKVSLTTVGTEQAIRAAQFLDKNLRLGRNNWFTPRGKVVLFVSPYARALQTSVPIRRILGSRIDYAYEHVALVEQQYGLFDGYTEQEWQQHFPDAYQAYEKFASQNGRYWARPPMGESLADIHGRMLPLCLEWARPENRYNTYIIVGHGMAMRIMTQILARKGYEWVQSEHNPENCAIRLIVGQDDKGYVYGGG